MHDRTTAKQYDGELRLEFLRPLQQAYYSYKAYTRSVPSPWDKQVIRDGEKLHARVKRKMKMFRREVWFAMQRENRNAEDSV